MIKYKKASKRKYDVYIIGFSAVIIISLAAVILANNLTFALDIPESSISGVAVLNGTSVAPADFFSFAKETEGIIADFLEPEAVDVYLSGRQEVVLSLRSGRRIGETAVPLYVLTPLPYMPVEAGTPVSYIMPLDFLPMAYIINSNTVLDVVIHSGLPDYDVFLVGEYAVRIYVNNVFFYSVINVVDTTPPTAILMDITVPMGQCVAPDDFIVSVFDMSPVIDIWFYNEPYVFAPGGQVVDIGFKDYFGNISVYSATLTVLPNTIPPRILGVQDMLVQIGNPIIFRQGVSAEDAFGRPINFSVDSTAVNIHQLGRYTVTYYAKDAWGLRTEVIIYVEVLEIDPIRVREMADAVLDNILREGMTQVEQARAIFNWVNGNVFFAANISRRTRYEGAYQAMRNRRGNCFVFYAISSVLLTQAGIPNMRIQRIEGTPTAHYWNLINPDGLGWHHFDATESLPIFGRMLDRFMFTSSQAREFTQLIHSYVGRRDHFTYNPELYPEIVQ